MSVDQFITQIIQDDRDISKIIDTWNMEKEEITQIVIEHFKEFGIFMVAPMEHAQLIYDQIHFQLHHSPKLRARLSKIQSDIEKAKAKHTRHEAG